MENFFANGRPILLLKSNKNEILFIKLRLKKVKHALNWILLMLRCARIQASFKLLCFSRSYDYYYGPSEISRNKRLMNHKNKNVKLITAYNV